MNRFSENTLSIPQSDIDPGFRLGEEYVIDANTLRSIYAMPNLKVVDVRESKHCPDGHLDQAIMFDIKTLTQGETGLPPSYAQLSRTLSQHGIQPDDFIVVYDDDTGVDAARLLWTLDLVGHKKYAMLNGGFAAWDEAGFPISDSPKKPNPETLKGFYPIRVMEDSIASLTDVHDAIHSSDTILLDTRSEREYLGLENRAQKSGHIPTAIHWDWEWAVDRINGGVLNPPELLLQQLTARGVNKDKTIIVYCQTNRRSAHTFVLLKWLGFPRVKAYPGSWAQWGNDPSTPVEV